MTGKIFIIVYIKLTTNQRFFLSRDFLKHMDSALDTLSTAFSHVATRVILD